jgi:hypothetical protein
MGEKMVACHNTRNELSVMSDKCVRFPILRQLYGWLGSLGDLVIERQDRRVVTTQSPPRPDLGIGELLIQADNPIV